MSDHLGVAESKAPRTYLMNKFRYGKIASEMQFDLSLKKAFVPPTWPFTWQIISILWRDVAVCCRVGLGTRGWDRGKSQQNALFSFSPVKDS